MSLLSIKIEKVIIENCCCEKTDVSAKVTGYISDLSLYDNQKLLFILKGKLNIMSVTLKDTQKATGKLSFVDSKGAATDVPDGNVAITSSDESIATVSYDDPTNTITVTAGVPGVAALKFDVKDDNGNVLPFDDVAVEVTSGNAVSGTVSFDTPVEA